MSNLERRYRALLKVLPRWYREDREEEMVGIFLADRTDELDLEHSWPGWGETAAVLGLAARTHLAAGAALATVPAKVVWRGEVVRAMGLFGLLLSVYFAGMFITSMAYAHRHPEIVGGLTWTRVFDVLPIAAFIALLAGKRTPAKVMAALAVLPGLVALVDPIRMGVWALYQLPALVTFACLCLGFHREAPTPDARRFGWWGGGALVLGLFTGFASGLGLVVVVLTVVIVRVVAFVRRDFVLGRALSLLAVLEVGPIAFPLLGGETWGIALGLLVLVVICALAPVRKPRVA
ncbi:hypothetical protein G7043_38545 [Lentzea sp. NEAU-D13]|uniref:Uncharacterized protein n=1 Tax=Lentzea alba TaxID=2714351 RepID=A0A7C9RWV5_9PSEU|nr:hypothetical protein [Lentzea alba]NGY64830.1 hypothetical protein [Lentzea alba]